MDREEEIDAREKKEGDNGAAIKGCLEYVTTLRVVTYCYSSAFLRVWF